MKKIITTITIGVFSLLYVSCKEKSIESNTPSNPSFSYQTSKCAGHGLSKSNALDSIFNYTFTNTLTIDFSVNANCCPDSNRFTVSHSIGTDTIVISVIDTAQNNCRCICLYFIHVEIGNLPNNQYIVRCTCGKENGIADLIHLVTVFRWI